MTRYYKELYEVCADLSLFIPVVNGHYRDVASQMMKILIWGLMYSLSQCARFIGNFKEKSAPWMNYS